jgi:hypothetical protein
VGPTSGKERGPGIQPTRSSPASHGYANLGIQRQQSKSPASAKTALAQQQQQQQQQQQKQQQRLTAPDVAAMAAADRAGSLASLNNALRNELDDLEVQLREAERAAFIPQPVTAILAPINKSPKKKKRRASTKLDWSIPVV